MQDKISANANMKNFKLIITLFAFALCTKAQQPCTGENVHLIPGKWKDIGIGSNITDHAAADAAKEKSVLKDIFNTIRNNFKWELQGGEIQYLDHSMWNADSKLPFYLSKKINSFRVYLSFHDFLCLHGKVDVNEPSADFTVLCNQLPFKIDKSFFTKTMYDPTPAEQNSEDMGTNVYYISNTLPNFENGIWDFYGGERNGGQTLTNDTSNLYLINHVYRVIARQGIAPVIVMTKKEYYSNWIKKLQFDMIENDKQIKRVNNSKDPYLDTDTKKKMSEMYQALKNVAAKNISAIEEVRKSLTSDQLAKPAVFREEQGKYIEVTDFFKNEFYILKPNPDYFNTNLPKSSVQLCSIDFYTGIQRYRKSQRDQQDPRSAVDQKFVDEILRMKAIELITQKIQPLVK